MHMQFIWIHIAIEHASYTETHACTSAQMLIIYVTHVQTHMHTQT